MRRAFIKNLITMAESDKRIILLTADLGYSVIEPFAEKLPKQFLNVGVAENNMIGLASGLADAGYIPFVYSIVPFSILRPYEFIRNGPVWHRLQVRIVGVGSGFEYANNGISHYGLEDIGVMRLQKQMTIVVPVDNGQLGTAMAVTKDLPGPIYFRLSKDIGADIAELYGRFTLGELDIIRNGSDVLILSVGPISKEAFLAADSMSKQGVSCAVGIVSSFNQEKKNQMLEIIRRYKMVVTVEDHYLTGGLGSLISELVATYGVNCRVLRCGIDGLSDGKVGSISYMRDKYKLTASSISDLIKAALNAT